MLSTRAVLRLLREINPDSRLTEERIRRVLRRGDISYPEEFAGRLAWSMADVLRLAEALGLDPPNEDQAYSSRAAQPDVA